MFILSQLWNHRTLELEGASGNIQSNSFILKASSIFMFQGLLIPLPHIPLPPPNLPVNLPASVVAPSFLSLLRPQTLESSGHTQHLTPWQISWALPSKESCYLPRHPHCCDPRLSTFISPMDSCTSRRIGLCQIWPAICLCK